MYIANIRMADRRIFSHHSQMSCADNTSHKRGDVMLQHVKSQYANGIYKDRNYYIRPDTVTSFLDYDTYLTLSRAYYRNYDDRILEETHPRTVIEAQKSVVINREDNKYPREYNTHAYENGYRNPGHCRSMGCVCTSNENRGETFCRKSSPMRNRADFWRVAENVEFPGKINPHHLHCRPRCKSPLGPQYNTCYNGRYDNLCNRRTHYECEKGPRCLPGKCCQKSCCK
jgi:hypothetical protein